MWINFITFFPFNRGTSTDPWRAQEWGVGGGEWGKEGAHWFHLWRLLAQAKLSHWQLNHYISPFSTAFPSLILLSQLIPTSDILFLVNSSLTHPSRAETTSLVCHTLDWDISNNLYHNTLKAQTCLSLGYTSQRYEPFSSTWP